MENVLEGYCIHITVVATKPPQPIHNWSNIACVTNAKQRWSDNGKTKERYICPCPLLFLHFYPVVFDMFSPSPLRETQAKKTWLLLHFEIQWYSAWEVLATKCAHSMCPQTLIALEQAQKVDFVNFINDDWHFTFYVLMKVSRTCSRVCRHWFGILGQNLFPPTPHKFYILFWKWWSLL